MNIFSVIQTFMFVGVSEEEKVPDRSGEFLLALSVWLKDFSDQPLLRFPDSFRTLFHH